MIGYVLIFDCIIILPSINMILTSHAIIGVVAASAFPSHPVLAFSVAVVSHYIMDAIPHWEYDLLSSKKDRNNPLNNDITIGKDFLRDLKKISADIFISVLASFIIFYFIGLGESILILIAGIAGGIAPDILQFAYFRFRSEPFKSLYIFHYWIHSRTEKLEEHFVVGICLQIFTISLIVFLVKYFMIM